jgi:long-chain acyl-CoA synthetase
MNLARLLERAGRAHPEMPALFRGDDLVASYGELAHRVAALAGSLRSRLNLTSGDCVALAMRNTPEFIEVLFACWHAGLVTVPVNPRLHAKELAYILENSGTRACFATRELADAIAALRSELPEMKYLVCVEDEEYRRLRSGDPLPMMDRAATDGAWLFYTSGTTGRPKGAELTHRNLLTMGLGYFADFETVSPGDRLLHIGPMCHGSGLYIVPHVIGCAAHVVPTQGFDTDEVFDLIARHPRTSFFAAPTIVKRLAESLRAKRADVSTLRTIVYGGAPMYAEDLNRARDCFGPRLAQIYGQGESPMSISVLSRACHRDDGTPRFRERLSSVGVAQSTVEVRIADVDDRTLPAGEPGEILVRGDTVMKGYWNNPYASRETLRGGWLHTGDVGVMDDSGFLFLKDRNKDVIISGGANIYPREVEEVLLRHPAVAEVSVVGSPDAEWGESVVAFVACVPGQAVAQAELDTLCIDNIARFKRPKTYRFVDALPKSHLGKVLKTELRQILRNER